MLDRPTSVVAATTVRFLATGASISLAAAGVVLIRLALGLPSPAPMFFIASITLVLALAALYTGALILRGNRRRAIVLLSVSLALLCLLPTIRFLPGLFRGIYNLDIEGLFPPLWPYSAAIPLLFFLLMEAALPSRKENEVPTVAVIFTVLASVMLLFFGASFINALIFGFLRLPVLIFNALAACLALAFVLIIGIVLPRKGMVLEGAALLLVAGFLLEILSIQFYLVLPSYTEIFEGYLEVERLMPVVPFLGGTVTGGLAALAGAIVFIRALREGLVVVPRVRRTASSQPVPDRDQTQLFRPAEPSG